MKNCPSDMVSDHTAETWAKIPEFPLYEASTHGRVRSIERTDAVGRRKKSTVLRQFFDSRHCYLCVNVWNNGKQKTMRVHRLIALAFIPNPRELPEVNHKDEIKTNNCVSNLEWCDHQYNNTYGSKRGKWIGERNVSAKYSRDEADFVRKNHVCNGGNMGTTELSMITGISVPHVSSIAHGRRRKEELSGIHP